LLLLLLLTWLRVWRMHGLSGGGVLRGLHVSGAVFFTATTQHFKQFTSSLLKESNKTQRLRSTKQVASKNESNLNLRTKCECQAMIKGGTDML
jgi:hypothetical protein